MMLRIAEIFSPCLLLVYSVARSKNMWSNLLYVSTAITCLSTMYVKLKGNERPYHKNYLNIIAARLNIYRPVSSRRIAVC
jgi:hypothetical protein